MCVCVSYWALRDVLGPLVHVRALLDGGAALLFEIPATVRVPSLHAVTIMRRRRSISQQIV